MRRAGISLYPVLFCLFLVEVVLVVVVMWNTGNHKNDLANENRAAFKSPDTAFPVAPLSKEVTPVILKWDRSGEYDITCKSFLCHVTSDKQVQRHHDVLGILFNGMVFGMHGFPLPRKPGHLWSLGYDDSPKFNNWLFTAEGAMNLFNLTSTFKRESHFPIPTIWLENESYITSKEFVVSLQMKNRLRINGLAPVVFIYSDCDTPSDRSHYMRLLQQYIQIDSYGKCEHNKDFPSDSLNLTFRFRMGPQATRDFYKLLAQYKFAFAFENAVCDDYITEKFWRPLRLGVVPLVFGSPKIKDFVPSKMSIIDIRDFRSVKEVADYITFLDTHDNEYSKYLQFKRTGITNPNLRSQLEQRDWDRNVYTGFEWFVCEKLHSLEKSRSFGKWFGKFEHYNCPKPKLFDAHGRYIIEENKWLEPYDYGKYYLQSISYHIDNNINADFTTLNKFATTLQKKDKKSKH